MLASQGAFLGAFAGEVAFTPDKGDHWIAMAFLAILAIFAAGNFSGLVPFASGLVYRFHPMFMWLRWYWVFASALDLIYLLTLHGPREVCSLTVDLAQLVFLLIGACNDPPRKERRGMREKMAFEGGV